MKKLIKTAPYIRTQAFSTIRKIGLVCFNTIRFVGGGALFPVTCQMLADITGRVIETIDEPQNAGTVGAALLIALGMKIIDTPEEAGKLIPVKTVYRPNMENKAVYERNYQVFRKLYKSNAKHFKALNGI